MTTTTTTNTPPTPPAPPKRRKVAVPVAIAAAAAFALGGLAGGALTASLGENDSCKAAVTQANEAIDLYSDALDLAADGIRGYSNNNRWAIREATDGLGEISDQLIPVLREYYTNEQECLGG